MELWIPITIFAAFSQNIRSALQKHLTNRLSTAGATQVRFMYALPFACTYLLTLLYLFDYSLPQWNWRFLSFAVIGGLSQIIATALLVSLFSKRSFIVGTTYSKTETIQTALVGLVFLGESTSLGALIAIVLGIIGVITLSGAKNNLSAKSFITAIASKAAVIGLLSGLFFGITSVSYRAAGLALEGSFIIRAAFLLVIVLTLQTLVTTIYIKLKEPGQLSEVVSSWRTAVWVGVAGMLASAGWFSATILENAAHVRAIGQVELLFAFLTSLVIFKEKTTKLELTGILLVCLSVIALLVFK